MTMSVTAAKPWATPGGMNTPRWLSPVRSSSQRGAVGRAALAQVVQHDAGSAERHVPVVGLVQVVVQPDDARPAGGWRGCPGHLAAVGEPLAPVGLDEQAALVAVDRRLDDPHAGDHVALGDVCHAVGLSTRRRSGSGRRPSVAAPAAAPASARTTASLPIRLSSNRLMSMILLRSMTTECSTSLWRTSQPSPIALNGPMKLFSTTRAARR